MSYGLQRGTKRSRRCPGRLLGIQSSEKGRKAEAPWLRRASYRTFSSVGGDPVDPGPTLRQPKLFLERRVSRLR